MNKAEYLDSLRSDLGVMPYNEVQEIVDEISAHFEGGLSKGKSEEQICDELGDVHELAKSYINITPNKLPAALRESAEKKPVSKGARVFVILFNIFVGAPLAFWWIVIDCGLVYSFVLNAIFFVARFTVMDSMGAYLVPAVIFQIASFFGLIVILCLGYFGITLFYRALKKYLRWNRKLWTKGF